MRSHPTDVLSLTFGLVFLGIVLFWALGRSVNVDLPPLGWLVAGGLILLGILGLVGSLRSDRTGNGRPPEADPAD